MDQEGREKMKTLISNNCIGGCISQSLKIQYNSPTVRLQISPEQYLKFCTNLEHYIEHEITPVEKLSPYHEEICRRLYWGEIPDYPLGLCDDILLCFQHYKTFKEAAEAWYRRAKRVDYNDIGFTFYARDEMYKQQLLEFIDLKLPHTAVFTENFDIDSPHARVDLEPRGNFIAKGPNGRSLYEQHFDRDPYMRGEDDFYI